jgi:hypothetical protein
MKAIGAAALWLASVTGAVAFLTQVETCTFVAEPVRPLRAELSGWYGLLASNFIMEQWYWDARVLAWRGDPDAFVAETPGELSCQGYTFFTREDAPQGKEDSAFRKPP